jgi:hypothetical protein
VRQMNSTMAAAVRRRWPPIWSMGAGGAGGQKKKGPTGLTADGVGGYGSGGATVRGEGTG